jgi:hypothetical protein
MAGLVLENCNPTLQIWRLDIGEESKLHDQLRRELGDGGIRAHGKRAPDGIQCMPARAR